MSDYILDPRCNRTYLFPLSTCFHAFCSASKAESAKPQSIWVLIRTNVRIEIFPQISNLSLNFYLPNLDPGPGEERIPRSRAILNRL